MRLEWPEHSEQLTIGLSELLEAEYLLDVTLAAGDSGQQRLKAHKVVLSAASNYFRDLLISTEETPIIFLRDVSFIELTYLIQFIYTGKTEVPGQLLSAFLKLAHTLGVKGFTDHESGSSDIKKDNETSINFDDLKFKTRSLQSSNQSVGEQTNESLDTSKYLANNDSTCLELSCVTSHSLKLPTLLPSKRRLYMASNTLTALTNEDQQNNKLMDERSLKVKEMSTWSNKNIDGDNMTIKTDFAKIISSPKIKNITSRSEPANIENSLDPNSPMSDSKRRRIQTRSLDEFGTQSPVASNIVLSPRWTNAPPFKNPLDSPEVMCQFSASNSEVKIESKSEDIIQTKNISAPNHSGSVSCPVINSTKEEQSGQTLLLTDPDVLAAKGATLLHHLALWMVHEKKIKEESGQQLSIIKNKENSGNLSINVPPSFPNTLKKTNIKRSTYSLRASSEIERPDSGFDSKDDSTISKDVSTAVQGEGTLSSSPEATEISRQTIFRQPVFRKKKTVAL